MCEGLLPALITTSLAIGYVRTNPLSQTGWCPVGFDFRANHNNTCCKPKECTANTFYILCNGTSSNPGYDSCRDCPPDRPVSEPINTAEAAKYNVVLDPCIRPDCSCPQDATPPLDNPCLKDGKKQCECDRNRGYFGEDYLNCYKADESTLHSVERPGYELSNTGKPRECLAGTFKATSDKLICRNHSRCPKGFTVSFHGSSTEDVRCKRYQQSTLASENTTTLNEKDDNDDTSPVFGEIPIAAFVSLVISGTIVVVACIIYVRWKWQNGAGRRVIDEVKTDIHGHLYLEKQHLLKRGNNCDNSSRLKAIEHAEDASYVAIGLNDLNQNSASVVLSQTPNVTSSDKSYSASENSEPSLLYSSVHNSLKSIYLNNMHKNRHATIAIYGDNNIVIPWCQGSPTIYGKCTGCHEQEKTFPVPYKLESLVTVNDDSLHARKQFSTLFDIKSVNSFPSCKNLAVPCPGHYVSTSGSDHQIVAELGTTLDQSMPTGHQYVPSPVIHDFDSLDMSSLWSENISDIYYSMGLIDTDGGYQNEYGGNSSTVQKTVYEAIRDIAKEHQDCVLSPQIEHSLNVSSLNSSREQMNMQVTVDQSIQFEDQFDADGFLNENSDGKLLRTIGFGL